MAYYVWTRHNPDAEHLDGFIGATCYDPNDRATGSETFTVHLVFDDWPKARELVDILREQECHCDCHASDGDPPEAGEPCCPCWSDNPYVEPITLCPNHGHQVLVGHGVVGEHTGDPYGTDMLACGCEIGALGSDPEDVFVVREKGQGR